MREIVLDTETTGFDPSGGDRIVEIGAIELEGHLPTGRKFHEYINPERAMPEEAFKVHGLGDEFLKDKPKFAQVGQKFLDFIQDSTLVIHNAAFDMKFLNFELQRMGLGEIPYARALDTLLIARKKFPGSPASLDALCRRFGITSFERDLHGALLDSEILAEVYLELIGGRQPDFALKSTPSQATQSTTETWSVTKRLQPLPSRLSEAEEKAHEDYIAKELGENALWRKS